MKIRNALPLLVLLLGQFCGAPAWAQQTLSPGAANDPLDFFQLLLLKVDGFSDQQIDAMLMQRGIDFQPNHALLDLARKLGITETVLSTWNAAPIRPYAGDPAARLSHESKLAQRDCRARLRDDPGNFLASITLAFALDPLAPAGESRDIVDKLEQDLRPRLERDPQNATLRDQLSVIHFMQEMPAVETIPHNEAYALGGVRTLIIASITYSATYNKGFPESTGVLAPPTVEGAAPTASAAGLVDAALASGTRSGYVFTYSPGARDAGGRIDTYTLSADPITPGTSGRIHYFVDQSFVIRRETGKPANVQSPEFENFLATLENGPRSIEILTSAGAEVFLDGSSRGTADAAGKLFATDVATGKHDLRVTAPGKKEYRQEITVPPLSEGAEFEARLTDLAPTLEARPVDPSPSTDQKPNGSLKYLFVQGQLSYAQKRYIGAGGMFEQALLLATGSNVPIVLFSLGDAWTKAASVETNPSTREQEQARALDCYHKALEANPSNAALHNSLGNLYATLGRSADADAEFKKATDLDPTHESSFHHIFDQGQTLYVLKHYSEAAAMFKEALPLARDKNLSLVTFALADARSKAATGETNPAAQEQARDSAMDSYRKALEADPDNADLHNNMGRLYAGSGRSADAKAEFKKAADLDPAHASTYYYNMGAMFLNRRDVDEATTALKKSTDIDPTNTDAWYWYGVALMEKAHVGTDGVVIPVPGTVDAFQMCLRLAPHGPHASAAQATLNGLEAKTVTEYRKGPSLSPNEAHAQTIRVRGQIESAHLIYGPPPEYPPQAKTARIQGVVRLDAIIGKDGTIEYLKVLSGPPLLIKAAMDNVQRWLYQPVALNGKPVRVATEIDLNFTLKEMPEP